MLDVVVREGHPEADLLQALDVLDEAFLFLVIDQVGLDRADLGIVDHRRYAERIDLDPLAVFPVFAALRDFPEIDLRIEVRREGFAVAAGVAVDDVDRVDLVIEFLLRVGAEDVGDARIESAAQDRHQTLVLELIVVGPLVFVRKFGFFTRLVVGGVHVVDARLEAGIHDRQILIRKRHVDDEVGLDLLQQLDGLGNVVGVDLRDVDRRLALGLNLLAAFEAARSEVNFLEDIAVHRAFLGNN